MWGWHNIIKHFYYLCVAICKERSKIRLDLVTKLWVLRSYSCEMIQLAGKLLKLPQVAMATGCVLFQRFYYAKSFVRINFEHVAMSCVVLASKIEEAPRRMRDIINVFKHIQQIRNGK